MLNLSKNAKRAKSISVSMTLYVEKHKYENLLLLIIELSLRKVYKQQ